MFLRAGFFAVLAGQCISLAAAFADAPSETVTIPLENIWAWHMPTTKNIQELEPSVFGKEIVNVPDAQREKLEHESLINQLQIGLGHHDLTKVAAPGFVVAGDGLKALREAHAVLCNHAQPSDTFSRNDELSIIFFTYSFGKYVELTGVQRKGDVIQVHYRFVPHVDMNLTTHFAIIPLGQFLAGKYVVQIIQDPQQDRNARDVSNQEAIHFISQPFSFTVK